MNTKAKPKKINAVVLAGGTVKPDDPLFPDAPNGHRALIDIHGKPMVQWVLEALAASDFINEIFIIGLTLEIDLQVPKPLHCLPDQGGLFENIQYGTLKATENELNQPKVLLVSADVPALKPVMVDWLVEQINKHPTAHIYYNVIERSVMESRYPNANRSFVPLKDIAVCGGDVNAVDRDLFAIERSIWQKLAEARKNPLKQVSYLGIHNVFLVALRLVTLDDAVRRVCKKLNIEGRVLLCPYAEIAMDADKPHQLAILRSDLEDKT